MEIINVIPMLDRGVPAVFAGIVIVFVVVAHFVTPLGVMVHRRRPGPLVRFGRMCQSVLNQVGNVLIGQSVIKMRSIAPAYNQAFTPQKTQPLRYG